jgi:transposase-like protein
MENLYYHVLELVLAERGIDRDGDIVTLNGEKFYIDVNNKFAKRVDESK